MLILRLVSASKAGFNGGLWWVANVFIATMTSSCSCRNVINLEPAHGGKSICMLVKLTMPTEFNTFTAVCIHVLASKNLNTLLSSVCACMRYLSWKFVFSVDAHYFKMLHCVTNRRPACIYGTHARTQELLIQCSIVAMVYRQRTWRPEWLDRCDDACTLRRCLSPHGLWGWWRQYH